MEESLPSRPWLAVLPYLLTLIGILCSVIAWHILYWDIQSYFDLLADFKLYLPWVVLLAGLSISILLGLTLRFMLSAKERNLILFQMNEDLLKEINEHMQTEQSKQKMELAMHQGQKLQAMGTLAGGIAHDFNNILYAIIGYVEMARDDVDKNSLIYANLGKVLEGAHRGQELVSRILTFSRRQHHQFTVIPLKPAIDAVLSLLLPTIPSSVMIKFDAETDASILGNQTQIHQVLVNLITNAIDAMDGEGSIRIHLTANETTCKIDISDTGHGMDQTTMNRIFEPFYTTKEVGKGTGLGLSIVHTIIKDHQGEVSVESQLGKGTTFVILLPIYSE